jgi:hypothetical protein
MADLALTLCKVLASTGQQSLSIVYSVTVLVPEEEVEQLVGPGPHPVQDKNFVSG